jgi:hypothetical protein
VAGPKGVDWGFVPLPDELKRGAGRARAGTSSERGDAGGVRLCAGSERVDGGGRQTTALRRDFAALRVI